MNKILGIFFFWVKGEFGLHKYVKVTEFMVI